MHHSTCLRGKLGAGFLKFRYWFEESLKFLFAVTSNQTKATFLFLCGRFALVQLLSSCRAHQCLFNLLHAALPGFIDRVFSFCSSRALRFQFHFADVDNNNPSSYINTDGLPSVIHGRLWISLIVILVNEFLLMSLCNSCFSSGGKLCGKGGLFSQDRLKFVQCCIQKNAQTPNVGHCCVTYSADKVS